MPERIDLTGRVFGRLEVLGGRTMRGKNAYWLCKCSCGTVKYASAPNLTSGGSKSCGCLSRDVNAARHADRPKYHIAHPGEFIAWESMKKRCKSTRPNVHKYYGGRGITVCDRWKDSFSNFYADMGNKPTPKHSLDRIDVNGNYEPGNCRWATSKEQSGNTRTNVRIEAYGELFNEAQWAVKTGISRSTLQHRRSRGYEGAILLAPVWGNLGYKGPHCVRYFDDYTKEELLANKELTNAS